MKKLFSIAAVALVMSAIGCDDDAPVVDASRKGRAFEVAQHHDMWCRNYTKEAIGVHLFVLNATSAGATPTVQVICMYDNKPTAWQHATTADDFAKAAAKIGASEVKWSTTDDLVTKVRGEILAAKLKHDKQYDKDYTRNVVLWTDKLPQTAIDAIGTEVKQTPETTFRTKTNSKGWFGIW